MGYLIPNWNGVRAFKEPVACSTSKCGFRIDIRGLHYGSFAQGEDVLALCARLVCLDSLRNNSYAIGFRNLPKVTYP